jgi:hypothetical protein
MMATSLFLFFTRWGPAMTAVKVLEILYTFHLAIVLKMAKGKNNCPGGAIPSENLHHSAWLIFPFNSEYTIEVYLLYLPGSSELLRKLKP